MSDEPLTRGTFPCSLKFDEYLCLNNHNIPPYLPRVQRAPTHSPNGGIWRENVINKHFNSLLGNKATQQKNDTQNPLVTWSIGVTFKLRIQAVAT